MKVTIVYQYYQGHGAPGHSLSYELTQYLAELGHFVTVVTGEVGYMQRAGPTLPWYRRLVRRERDGKVNIVRTYTYVGLHRSYGARLLSFLSFFVSCPVGLLTVEKPDVVLASSPPIFPILSAWTICRLRRIPFVLEVRDLWPASAVQLGIVSNRHLIAVMTWMERFLYDHSAKIIALTRGIRDDICARGWAQNKVELVTCGVDTTQLYPDAEAGAGLRRAEGWQDKKIVLYFGALGEANNVPVILRAAKRLRPREDILFVLVGDGMKRKESVARVAELGLTNVHIMPPAAKHDARMFINAADLCLVTLRDIPLFRGAIPTKLIDYMACGKPVLCGVSGEAKLIVEEAGAGCCFPPDDDAQLGALIVDMLAKPQRTTRMGTSGLEYVRAKFSAEEMRCRMEALLLDAAQTSRRNVT